MLVNDVGSRNVYENKQKDDNLPEEKSDISTQRNSILYGNTLFLLKPSALFSSFERCGTNCGPIGQVRATTISRVNRV
jgi:hypothetical protein